jgi:hypothetical protein
MATISRNSSFILDPSLDGPTSTGIMVYDPRYFTTYYAIDAISFKPVNLSSAPTRSGTLSAAGHQEAAGLPLDPSFAEQTNSRALQGLLRLCGRGGSASLQPASDRRRADQRPLMAREGLRRMGSSPPLGTPQGCFGNSSRCADCARAHERWCISGTRFIRSGMNILSINPMCLWPSATRLPCSVARIGVEVSPVRRFNSPITGWRLARPRLQRRDDPPGGAGN